MQQKKKRNWSQYNQRLKQIARVDFFISKEVLSNWYYEGKRKPGGKIRYPNYLIELCAVIREYYKLGLRQTEGFIGSLIYFMGYDYDCPDYTTISRRGKKLTIDLSVIKGKSGIVVAVDSTGLTVHSQSEWKRIKHKDKQYSYNDKWRKLHIIIDTSSGQILQGSYTGSDRPDCGELPGLLEGIHTEIDAVAGDMAYDTLDCRKAIYQKKAHQLIPPVRRGVISTTHRETRKHKDIFKERDEAINYINANKINGDIALARKQWKVAVGYHRRSLVETTMSQIKAHCSDRLTNRTEASRKNQALIKCKTVNYINAAMRA